MLARRYQLTRQLGEGGMGQVFEAKDTVLGRKVAVKLISPHHQMVDPQAVKRMFREARAAAKIRHENVVEIIDFVADEPAFLLMELLEGKSLRGLLREFRSARQLIPWKRVCTFVAQVLAALDAAHRAGIIHRDIKPSNCFLVDDPLRPDRIKVVDFGVARVERSGNTNEHGESPTISLATRPGLIVGTSPYLAPELWLGDPADARSDLYAVGVMTYELLLGVRPFRGSNMELQLKHTTQEPKSPRERKPGAGIPEWLNAFVMRLLAKQPADRFESAREALMLLTQVARDEGLEVGVAASLVAPVVVKPSRWPIWVAAGLGVAGVAITWLVATSAGNRGAQPQASGPTTELTARSSATTGASPIAATGSQTDTAVSSTIADTTGAQPTDASTTDSDTDLTEGATEAAQEDPGSEPAEATHGPKFSVTTVRRKLLATFRTCAKEQKLWDPLKLSVSGVVTRRGGIEQLAVQPSDRRAYGVISSCFLARTKKLRVPGPRREHKFQSLKLSLK